MRCGGSTGHCTSACRRGMGFALPAAAALILMQLPACCGSVLRLHSARFEADGFWWTAEAVWSKTDVGGKKDPHIHLDADFSRSAPGESGHLDVLMFRAEMLAEIGAQPNTMPEDDASEVRLPAVAPQAERSCRPR